MAIRDILVHLDNSSASALRLNVAIAYALKHGARLRGLYLITHFYYEPRALGEKADSEKAEQLFTDKTSEAGILSDWVFQDCSTMGSNVSDLITMHAYFTDLLIMGQVNLSAPAINIPTDLVERVILACGRPVLVIPYSGIFNSAGDRIMIAWKGGRESIRAVNDALPHLQKARTVDIVVGKKTKDNLDPTTESIKNFLLKHGVIATVDVIISGNFPIGDMLLNNVCEKNIDLLVMGVYAPNRRGKLEMSSVAQHVLKHLTAPVLMSH
ncbi:MAG: universal stress protein [Desulfuromonadales bacterium]